MHNASPATAARTARPPRRHPRPLTLRLVLAGLTLALLSVVAPSAQSPASGQVAANPILFVHGWNSSATTWNTMINRFVAAGYPRSRLLAITYNSNQSNATIANQVRDAATSLRSSTGAAKIDIVTHSMGGLSSRYYLKNLGGSSLVDDWVSLGGPNHGTNFAYACWLFSAGCRDMIGGSGFLNALNPDSSVLLSGATNTGVGCLGHSELHSNAGVFNQVRAFVA
jgi:triacylglycerol lipase